MVHVSRGYFPWIVPNIVGGGPYSRPLSKNWGGGRQCPLLDSQVPTPISIYNSPKFRPFDLSCTTKFAYSPVVLLSTFTLFSNIFQELETFDRNLDIPETPLRYPQQMHGLDIDNWDEIFRHCYCGIYPTALSYNVFTSKCHIEIFKNIQNLILILQCFMSGSIELLTLGQF